MLKKVKVVTNITIEVNRAVLVGIDIQKSKKGLGKKIILKFIEKKRKVEG